VFNLQGSEIVVILLLALVVLGPEKLPDAVRKFTQTYAELKKMSTGFQSELKSALDEPMREMRETAGLVRNAADPRKLMAEMENEERLLKANDTAAAEPAVAEQTTSQTVADQTASDQTASDAATAYLPTADPAASDPDTTNGGA
jgi:sec-independent protein translocase protein TatB